MRIPSSPRKRFAECAVCRTTLIFPENDAGFSHCPVCSQQSAGNTVFDGMTSEDSRLEQFFSRFA